MSVYPQFTVSTLHISDTLDKYGVSRLSYPTTKY